MRILMTGDTVGGVWTYALELARALEPRGVEIVLATMGRPVSAIQHEAARRLRNLTLLSSAYKLEWMADPWAEVAEAGEWLLELERRFAPDLVHLNGFVHGALPWRSPCLVVGHSCVLSSWEAVNGGPAPASWDRYRLEVTRGLRAAVQVAAPTSAMLETLRRHYGPLRCACTLYNGRSALDFRPGAKGPIIFSAGRLWDEAENLQMLAAAAVDLPWSVYVAGDDRRPDGGRASCGAAKLLGPLPVEQLRAWLGRAAIYALPARYEPTGLSVLEAGLSGCALVLGDIPSLREVWGEAACFVPPNDAAALTRMLRRLIADPELRRSMSEAARRRALTFSAERMAAGYYSLYQELTAGGAAIPIREALPCA